MTSNLNSLTAQVLAGQITCGAYADAVYAVQHGGASDKGEDAPETAFDIECRERGIRTDDRSRPVAAAADSDESDNDDEEGDDSEHMCECEQCGQEIIADELYSCEACGELTCVDCIQVTDDTLYCAGCSADTADESDE